jgi:hypothetical protein
MATQIAQKTAVKDLSQKSLETFDEKELLDEKNLQTTSCDMTIPEDIRMKALELYYNKHGMNETVEIINKLAGQFQFSGINLLKSYLYNICVKSGIHPFLKTIIIKSLCAFNKEDDTGYKAIDIVYPSMGHDVPIPCKVEIVVLLMHNKKYKEQAKIYFCDIINDDAIECVYRYKTILGLEHADFTPHSGKKKNYFITEACWSFVGNTKNPTLYRILSGQYLLRTPNLNKDRRDTVEKMLVSFSTDNDLDYNLRADSADVLLQLGRDGNKLIARDIILLLGRENHLTRTVFDNAQNVHTTEIEKSVLEIIEFLATMPTATLKSQEDLEEEKTTGKTVRGTEIDYAYVKAQILKLIETEKTAKLRQPASEAEPKYEREEIIKVALDRIFMDRALYSKYSCTLSFILVKIWSFISGHDSEKEMTKRLLDELVEAAGTCSSGFASRLVNSITGFGDFSLRISWREQIVANLGGRLNARARAIDDIEFQEQVLCEMTIQSNDYESRKHFLKFFRQNLLDIRDEMYSEFCKYIDESDFDLGMRAAISVYEIGSYV